jgi:Na+-translocating ferredoxin:NAD+ oxidoreductase RnfG subunit
MNYLYIITSILFTLLSIITIAYIIGLTNSTINDYNKRQQIKNRLHPEVTLKDLDDEDALIYVSFDKQLTQMVLDNNEEGKNEPISIMLMEDDDDDD